MFINKAEILEDYSYFSINIKKGDRLNIIEQDQKVAVLWYKDKRIVVPNNYVRIIEENLRFKFKENQMVTDGSNIFKIKSSIMKDNKIAYIFHDSKQITLEENLEIYIDETENIFLQQFLKVKPYNIDINKCKDFLYWLNTEEGTNYLKLCKYDIINE